MAGVSVVMPVHNGMPYLDASIESVLRQTYDDFELVVLENGSSDGSADRLDWWAARDSRVKLQRAGRRLGGGASSSAAVKLASCPLVARMDADDVADPRRLARQLSVMQEHPDAALVTTLHGYLDARGRKVRGRDRWPLRNGAAEMPFSGGCLMFRRSAYDEVGGYVEVDGTWEDLDLCVRLARVGRVLVIPESLYWVRFHVGSRTAGKPERLAVRSATARTRALGHGRAEPSEVAAGALLELNAMQLWSGGRPASLAALRAAARGCRARRRVALAAWARWAQLSPPTLRAALRWRSRLRDRIAAAWVPATRPVEWRAG
jgi:GT2 family glycosyltransferase